MTGHARTTDETLAAKAARPWRIVASPLIWAAHFMLCYLTAAIWCAKLPDPRAPLLTVRVAILIYTAVALIAIAIVGYVGYLRHAAGDSTLPHDADSPADRNRFLGFATVLLSGLSGVAVFYAALAALFIETCQ